MSHAPSSLCPSRLSTTSLSTCTPILPCSCPSTRPLLMSSSHGDFSCADPLNVSSGLMAEMHSPTKNESNYKKWRKHFATEKAIPQIVVRVGVFLECVGTLSLCAFAASLAMLAGLMTVCCTHRTPNPHAMSRSRTRDFSRALLHSLSCHQSSHA